MIIPVSIVKWFSQAECRWSTSELGDLQLQEEQFLCCKTPQIGFAGDKKFAVFSNLDNVDLPCCPCLVVHFRYRFSDWRETSDLMNQKSLNGTKKFTSRQCRTFESTLTHSSYTVR